MGKRLVVGGLKILVVFAVFVLAIIFPYPNSANALYWRDESKITNVGCVLGACIGDLYVVGVSKIVPKINHQYSLCILDDGPDEGDHSDSCDIPPKNGEALFVLRDKAWRNGSIDLYLENQTITAIRWEFSGPFHPDF